jgi:GNAT superfamily N-acetyltransferase
LVPETFRIALSPLDEQRFGIRSARVQGLTLEQFPEVLEFCRANGVVFLIARCPASDLMTAQAMERQGFLIMDTLVYCTRDLRKTPLPPDGTDMQIRSGRREDLDEVLSIAHESFRGYQGHYHADQRLDRTKCDEAYASWAERSITTEGVVDEVLIAEQDGGIVGFMTLRMNNPNDGEAVLSGVRQDARGRGIYRSFIIRAMEWCVKQRANQMIVSTQITNVAVQKVWTRLGFEFSHAYYTFHKWFDTE